MKRFELFFTFLKLPLDYFMLILAGFTAYFLRFSDFITKFRPIIFEQNLTLDKYWILVLIVAAFWILIFIFAGLYHTNPNQKLLKDLGKIFFACSASFAAITIYVFFTMQKFDSRFLVLTAFIFAIIYVSFGRIIIKITKTLLRKNGFGLRNTVIIGDNKISKEIKQNLENKRGLGYKIVGFYKNFNAKTEQQLSKNIPDEIIIADTKTNEEEAMLAIDFANEHHITLKYSADLFSTVSANMTISTIAGIPIIELKRTKLGGWGSILKRSFDILGSVILIILFSPLYLFTTIGILIETGLPIIYKNKRVGQLGTNFFTLKFRSMRKEFSTGEQFGQAGKLQEEKEKELIKKQSIKIGPVYKIKNDPRITQLGHFIRRWSLDELPQFINVLKGEMSLVGPRPHQPREVEKYEKKHRQILTIKPGITGLSQISGRSNLAFSEEAKLDIFYIENWNLLTDIIILIKTPFIVLKKTGAI